MLTINNKQYKEKPIDFNATIEMQELGGDLYQVASKPLAVLRAYFAYCAGLDATTAGEEISAHIVGGGDLADLSEALNRAMEESDFFKAMVAKATAEENSAKAK